MSPPPMQQQPEETSRRRHLIANYHTTETKVRNYATRTFTIDLSFGQQNGRPYPAVTRTLECEADIASVRNGQQMSAKWLQRRWKHEIQIALRRRAAMTRAVLPNTSSTSRKAPRRDHRQGRTSLGLPPEDLAATTMQTPRLTQPCQMTTMTSPPSPVNHSTLCSHQASKLPGSTLWSRLLPLCHDFSG